MTLHGLAPRLRCQIEIVVWLHHFHFLIVPNGFDFYRPFLIVDSRDSSYLVVEHAALVPATGSVEVALLRVHSVMDSVFAAILVLLLGALLVFEELALRLAFRYAVEHLVRTGGAVAFEGLLLEFDGAVLLVLFLQGFFHLVEDQADDLRFGHASVGLPLDVKFQ